MDNKTSPTVVITKKDIVDENTVRNLLKTSYSVNIDETSDRQFSNSNLVTSTPIGVKSNLKTRISLRNAAKLSGNEAVQKLDTKDELQTIDNDLIDNSLNLSQYCSDQCYVDIKLESSLASLIGQQMLNPSNSIADEFDSSPPEPKSRKKSRKNPTPKRKRNNGKVAQDDDDDDDDEYVGDDYDVIMNMQTPICLPKRRRSDEAEKSVDELDSGVNTSRKRLSRSAALKARQKVRRLDWDDEHAQMSSDVLKDEEYVEEESMKMEEDDDDYEDDEDNDSISTTRKSSGKTSVGRETSKKRKWMDTMEKDLVLKLRKQQQMKNLFPDWMPKKSSFEQLTFEEGKQYLPVNQKVKFRIQSRASTVGQSVELDLFDCHKAEDSFTIKIGGPLWAMDWCPTPMDKQCDQFLALYTHQSAAQTFAINMPQNYENKCLIQIWNFGKLSNRMSADPPELLPLLVMEGGPIWQMKWSPGASSWNLGDDDDDDGGDGGDDDGDVFNSRLGLLACACHSGNVKILSIPRLQNKDSQKFTTKNISFHKANPILTLKTTGSSCIPCTCVDWNIGGKNVIVAAGFADGSVSLWNLGMPTSLLGGSKVEDSNPAKNFMHPYKTFKAHLSVVSGLHFCPTSDDLLLTCSHDKFMKVWNIHDTNRCVLAHRTYKITASTWPAYERSRFYAGFDEAYILHRNTVACYNFYESKVVHISLCVHNGTITSVSHKEWSSIITSCDNTGCVQSCLSLPDKIKGIFSYRKMVSMMEVDADNEDERSGCDCKSYHKPSKDDVGSFPISCCCNKSFLIKDYSKNWQFKSAIKSQQELPFDDLIKNPYSALHKLSWNTNKQCPDWLAFGGLNGLLRIRLVPDVNAQKK